MRVTGNRTKYDETLNLYDFDTYAEFGILPVKEDSRRIFLEYVGFKKTGYNLILKALNNSKIADSEKEEDIKLKLKRCDRLCLG